MSDSQPESKRVERVDDCFHRFSVHREYFLSFGRGRGGGVTVTSRGVWNGLCRKRRADQALLDRDLDVPSPSITKHTFLSTRRKPDTIRPRILRGQKSKGRPCKTPIAHRII